MGLAPAQPPPCYFAFERSFPPPDTFLAVALIVSGLCIERGWARDLSLACGGALVFLGVLDLSFSAQNGVFGGPLADALQSAAISPWCIALGVFIIANAHTNRSAPA